MYVYIYITVSQLLYSNTESPFEKLIRLVQYVVLFEGQIKILSCFLNSFALFLGRPYIFSRPWQYGCPGGDAVSMAALGNVALCTYCLLAITHLHDIFPYSQHKATHSIPLHRAVSAPEESKLHASAGEIQSSPRCLELMS